MQKESFKVSILATFVPTSLRKSKAQKYLCRWLCRHYYAFSYSYANGGILLVLSVTEIDSSLHSYSLVKDLSAKRVN